MPKKRKTTTARRRGKKGPTPPRRVAAAGAAAEILARNDKALREHLLYLLWGGGAHLAFDKVVVGLPAALRGMKPTGVPFTFWRLLEHMRIAQWDILLFCTNPEHVSPEWTAGYWPKTDAPPDGAAWDESVKEFRADLRAVQSLVADPKIDLYARIPHGDGQTILREALLVADHNAYHLGQLLMLRRLLGSWTEE